MFSIIETLLVTDWRLTRIMIDILAKTIVSEEAVVRKAGGKFKMNPLFPSTVAKIKAVSAFSLPSKLLMCCTEGNHSSQRTNTRNRC